MQTHSQRPSPPTLQSGHQEEGESRLPPASTAPRLQDAASPQTERPSQPSALNSSEDTLAQMPPAEPLRHPGSDASPQNLADTLEKEPPGGQKDTPNRQQSQNEAGANAGPESRHQMAPEVDPYYFRVNWPQELHQRWARKKERGRGRRRSRAPGQDESGSSMDEA